MNSRICAMAFATTALALIAAMPPKAQALTMSVTPSSIHQVAFTAGVSLGHSVSASSNFNRLFASGTFEAKCPSSYLYPIPGSRGLSAQSLIFGTSLTVTIPIVVPTVMDMPGFDALPGGTSLTCDYNWTAYAEEGSYTIGGGGFGITIGGEKANDSGRVPFDFYKPADGDGDSRGGCMR